VFRVLYFLYRCARLGLAFLVAVPIFGIDRLLKPIGLKPFSEKTLGKVFDLAFDLAEGGRF